MPGRCSSHHEERRHRHVLPPRCQRSHCQPRDRLTWMAHLGRQGGWRKGGLRRQGCCQRNQVAIQVHYGENKKYPSVCGLISCVLLSSVSSLAPSSCVISTGCGPQGVRGALCLAARRNKATGRVSRGKHLRDLHGNNNERRQ